ncbi:MAG: PIN domain-containing protein [Nanoarchaeota archaeon]
MTSKYVFDTYAIMEIIDGNEDYDKYLDSDIIINNFIFAELCYNLYRDKDKRAGKTINKYSKYINSIKSEWIDEAMKFRLDWKDRSVSITDCVSYIMSKHIGVKFLTGDKEFENIENVEFVK